MFWGEESVKMKRIYFLPHNINKTPITITEEDMSLYISIFLLCTLSIEKIKVNSIPNISKIHPIVSNFVIILTLLQNKNQAVA